MLISTARDTSKAEAVLQKQRGSHPDVLFEVLQMDLSSLQSVRDTVDRFMGLNVCIDVLVNNAGVMGLSSRTLSIDGNEMHFATNFLGHFLLTNLLVKQSLARAHGIRIVNVTNAGFVLTPIRFSDLSFSGQIELPEEEQVKLEMAKQMGMAELLPTNPGDYVPLLAYSHSGTALMLFTQELARRYAGRDVVAIAAAPGGRSKSNPSPTLTSFVRLFDRSVVKTQLQRHMPSNFRNSNMFYKTPSQGAASFVVAALDPKLIGRLHRFQPLIVSTDNVIGANGCFIDDCQVVGDVAAHASNPTAANALWKVAETLVNQEF